MSPYGPCLYCVDWYLISECPSGSKHSLLNCQLIDHFWKKLDKKRQLQCVQMEHAKQDSQFGGADNRMHNRIRLGIIWQYWQGKEFIWISFKYWLTNNWTWLNRVNHVHYLRTLRRSLTSGVPWSKPMASLTWWCGTYKKEVINPFLIELYFGI